MTREELNEEMQNKIFETEKKEKTKKLVKKTSLIILALLIISTLFFTYTTYISTAKIKVREYRVINEKIPTAYNGLKILHFSDLHYGTTMNDKELKHTVSLINERNPDLVLFTGDLISKNYKLTPKEQEKIINNLKSINSTIGKYAIFGEEDTEIISTIYNQSEFSILRNEYDLIYKNSLDAILLVGLTTKDTDIEKAYTYFKEDNANKNIYTITITHQPDTVDEIYYPTDLILAGHSHNGNIRLPFVKFSLLKKEGAKKYDQDYYKLEDRELFISSGLGTQKGIRLFCRPSISIYRLSNY